jgi:hypothetical protein
MERQGLKKKEKRPKSAKNGKKSMEIKLDENIRRVP